MIENEHGKFCEVVNPETNEIIMTAEEYYNAWLEKKDKQIDILPEKTMEQKVEDLINQVTVMDEIIANLTLEVL